MAFKCAFLSVWRFFEPTIDWIVVARFYSVVYLAVVGCPVFRTHHVVNAHVKPAHVIRYARPVSRFNVAVAQLFGDGSSGIRVGSVVEVTAYNHAHVPVCGDVLCYGIGLCGSDARRFPQFLDEYLGACLGQLAFDVTLNYAFEVGFVCCRQSD